MSPPYMPEDCGDPDGAVGKSGRVRKSFLMSKPLITIRPINGAGITNIRRRYPKSLARMACHNEGHAVAAAQRRLAGKRRQLTLRTQLLKNKELAVGLTFRLPTKPRPPRTVWEAGAPTASPTRFASRSADPEVAKIARMDDWEWPATIHSTSYSGLPHRAADPAPARRGWSPAALHRPATAHLRRSAEHRWPNLLPLQPSPEDWLRHHTPLRRLR